MPHHSNAGPVRSGGHLSIADVLVVILTIFFPPVGVFLVTGCNADLLINIVLTIFGYFPGHIHAFYVLFVYYSRREYYSHPRPFGDDGIGAGILPARERAPLIFSERVQNGGVSPSHRHGPARGSHAGYHAPPQQPVHAEQSTYPGQHQHEGPPAYQGQPEYRDQPPYPDQEATFKPPTDHKQPPPV